MFFKEHYWESNSGLPARQNMLLYHLWLQSAMLNQRNISFPINLHTEIPGISLKITYLFLLAGWLN